jgi:hypothetical protein
MWNVPSRLQGRRSYMHAYDMASSGVGCFGVSGYHALFRPVLSLQAAKSMRFEITSLLVMFMRLEGENYCGIVTNSPP